VTDHPLQAWRDTLEELGVMGLVREPVQVAPAAPVIASEPPPVRQPAARPTPTSAPRPAVAYAPPTDPIGCPTSEAVAGATSLQELQLAIQGCLACPLGPGRL